MKTETKIKAATGMYRVISAARKLIGRGDLVRVVRKRVRWELDLSEGIDLAIFLFGQFENSTAKVLKKLVRPGATVFDIGANIGAHTLPLARLVGPKGKVYAFEPTAYAFGKLKRNLAQNPDLTPRVLAEQVRLTSPRAGDSPEIYSSWRLVRQEPRHEKHFGIPKSTEGSRSMTLDDYWETAGAPRVEIIKLDVDGFEVEVIQGSKRMLKQCRAPICMELSPYVLEERGSSFAELFKVLGECGYQLVDLKRRLPIVDANGTLGTKIPDGAGINVLALATS
jgi:FkbM family methyltransferase